MNDVHTAEIVNDEKAIARRNDDPQDLLRFAVERGANVETLERLMAVRRELNAEKSKAAFDTSMAAFQAECPIIKKRKSGAKDAYKYAPLDDIVIQTRDLIQKHGFSFQIDSQIEQGWVKAICHVTHSAGHSKSSEMKVPIDTRNPMMNDPQRYAGSMTFAKRYAFCNAFGILTGDEDNDGSGTRSKPAGPARATVKTRQWMLDNLKDVHPRMLTYGIDKAIIEPNQSLEDWPLEHVPCTPAELKELRKKIESHV